MRGCELEDVADELEAAKFQARFKWSDSGAAIIAELVRCTYRRIRRMCGARDPETAWDATCHMYPSLYPGTKRGKQYWAKQGRPRWGKGARKR